MIREFQGEYRWLSNFASVQIEFEGKTYPSVEHAYMSAKSADESWKELCANGGLTSGQIKQRSHKVKLVPKWEEIKLQVMKECLILKFNQQPYKNLLLKTGDMHIQEGNNWNDKFWGVSLKDNQGQNNLGKLIMSIRESI